jgi:protease secretion system outer membrane protein
VTVTKPNLGARLRRRVCAAAALLMAAGSAAAVTLQQAYELALKNDPAYRMNFYENESAKENRVLGRSSLLPTISGSFSGSKNVADQDLREFGTTIPSHPRYISRSSAVQVRQPLLNLDAITRYRQGKVLADQGAAVFALNTGQVALRVVGAYVDALFADDQLALAKVQRDMYQEQMHVNQRLFEKGEGTRTDMLETQARLDLAEAQLVEAQDNVVAMRDTLAGVIGADPGTLQSLGESFRVGALAPASFDDWRVLALAHNPELAAARLAVENARLEIVRNRAGHLPRIDLVAAYSKGDAESLNTYNQSSVNRTLGVQVNIPLYAGGSVNALTRQAAANYERARADLDARSDKVLVELRKAHSLVLSSVRKIEALDKAVASGKLLMTATAQSIKGGVRINLDLLNAQQQLVTSQRDLAQARYAYLVGLLRLRAAAGTLDAADVRAVGAYFH